MGSVNLSSINFSVFCSEMLTYPADIFTVSFSRTFETAILRVMVAEQILMGVWSMCLLAFVLQAIFTDEAG